MTEEEKVNGVSPLKAAAEGGNEHQVKMAGTNAAKQGEGLGDYFGVGGAKKAIVPETKKASIAKEKAYFDTRSRISEEAQKAAEKAMAESSLLNKAGSIGDQIRAAITSKIGDLYKEDMDLVDAEGISEDIKIDAESDKAVGFRAIFEPSEEVETEEARGIRIKESIGKWAVEYGYTDPTTGKVTLSWDDINQMLPTMEDTVAEIVATGLDDNIAISDSMLADLGYTTPEIEELKDLLSLNEGDTLAAFQEKARNYEETTYGNVSQLEAKLYDPQLPTSERIEILSQLRELGFVGTLASRESLDKIVDDIEASDQNIELFGRTFDSIEDALSDSAVTVAVTDYLNGVEDVELPQGLKDIVDNNREAFEKMSEDLELDIEGFKEVQDEYAKYATPDMKNISEWAGIDTSAAYQTEMPEVESQVVTEAANGDVFASSLLNSAITRLGKDADSKLKDAIFNLTEDQLFAMENTDGSADIFLSNLGIQQKFDDYEKLDDDTKNGMDTADTAAYLLGFKSGDDFADLAELSDDLIDFGLVEEGNALKGMLTDFWADSGEGLYNKLNGLISDGKLLKPETTGGTFLDFKEHLQGMLETAQSENVVLMRDIVAERGDVVTNIGMLTDARTVEEWQEAYRDLETAIGIENAEKYYEDVFDKVVFSETGGVPQPVIETAADKKLWGDMYDKAIDMNLSKTVAGSLVAITVPFGNVDLVSSEKMKEIINPIANYVEDVSWEQIKKDTEEISPHASDIPSISIPEGFKSAFKVVSAGRVALVPLGSGDSYNPAVQNLMNLMRNFKKVKMSQGKGFGRDEVIEFLELLKYHESIGGTINGAVPGSKWAADVRVGGADTSELEYDPGIAAYIIPDIDSSPKVGKLQLPDPGITPHEEGVEAPKSGGMEDLITPLVGGNIMY